MAEFHASSLTDSSDESVEGSPPRKRFKPVNSFSGFSGFPGFSGFSGSGSDGQDTHGPSDRTSTDTSLPEDDILPHLSDEESIMTKMMKEAKPKAFVDNKAQKMMEKMGYRAGKGLGKHSQGRVDPIEVSRQRGRRGLGLHLPGLEAADIEWNSEMEEISFIEQVFWLEDKHNEPLTEHDFDSWFEEGPRKLSIDDETHFCDPKVLKNVLSCKSVFDKLEPEEMRKARTRSNPFETIRGGFFLNRAAMKMANMDKVFDFMFTQPKDENGQSLIGPSELLYFADVCAGPGGFSEYVLWRRRWHCKGFGFTLRNENDFKLSDFHAGPCETFEPYYGASGDGNVFDPENIVSLKNFVMEQTGYGVHFMMADGGFSVEGQENLQEILSKQLYLCQFLVALCIVREGGHFVCKLFDVFTPFSVGLVYLMYKAFKKISIHKPNTSRPANSERYIICKWKRGDCDAIRDYMFRINQRLWKLGTTGTTDVTSIVSLSVMKEDTNFFDYIVDSNNSLGERQVINLVKIAAFCRDTSLAEPKQAEMRKASLEYWGLPDKARTAPPRVSPDSKCEELIKLCKINSSNFIQLPAADLLPNMLRQVFKSVYDWHCVVIGSSKDTRNCTFYLGTGRNRVYSWESKRWQKVDGNVELSPDTLVYAEIIEERHDRKKKMKALHIVDALVLGGVSISHEHLTVRHALCLKFAKAHQKPSRPDLMPIRVKKLYDLEDIESIFERLQMRVVKGAGNIPRVTYSLEEDDERFFIPAGVLFFKATQSPWMRYFSKSTLMKYYASPNSKDSVFDKHRPPAACGDFEYCFSRRCVWWWGEGFAFEDSITPDVSKLQREEVVNFVKEHTAAAEMRRSNL